MDDKTRALYFSFFNEVGIIGQLSRALMEARLPPGITVPHFSVLNHLVRVQDGRTPLEIARAFQVPKTSLTNTLAGLEKRGLVEMRANPADGRSKRVWLTDAGRAFPNMAAGLLGPDIERLADQISVKDVKVALDHLTRIREVMDADRDEPHP